MARKGGKIWEVRPDYRPLLVRAKKLFPTLLGHVKIDRIFLVGFRSRNSRYIAKISGNKRPWSIALPQYDYAIQFWSTRFDDKEKSYKLFVVVHELFHILRGGFEEGNRKEYRKCLHHDVEDFSFLLDLYGIHLEKVEDVLKGEAILVSKKKGPRRFPRTLKIG